MPEQSSRSCFRIWSWTEEAVPIFDHYTLTDVLSGTLYNLEISYANPHTISGRVINTLDLNAGLQSRNTLGPIQAIAFPAPDEVMSVRQRVSPVLAARCPQRSPSCAIELSVSQH